MNKDTIDAINELLNKTVDAVETHQKNFKIIEAELIKINGNLAALKMLNSIIVGCLASASKSLKSSLRLALEQLLEYKHELPGDFEKQAKNLLSAVCGSVVQESPTSSFRLHLVEKKDLEK